MAACIQVAQKTSVNRLIPPLYMYWKRAMKPGNTLPDIELYDGSPSSPVNVRELYKGKRGVLFSVLGAFTPGCSQAHIPDYLSNYEHFKDEGYDLISCVAVNDPFVMDAWGKMVNPDGKIKMLADPRAEFTKAMNMELDCTKLMGNVRSKRYSLVIEDSIIKSCNLEPDHTGLACLLCIQNIKLGELHH
ncbi:peroxiredoxin-5, mitochondrial-like [Liolophura sinensis]|uniref:peroxiredoxin-5, mitochondrial-like n=1 Tax=Liolophura sinensis TaxID=3198878 RepID=UPI0031598486